MDREKVKKMLPIFQAFAEGKTIEYDNQRKWVPIRELDIVGIINPELYRIKPEPKYRPFESAEECWAEMLKHQPFGWLGKYDDEGHPWYENIETVMDGTIWLDDDIDNGIMFESVIDKWTFADGAPFGVKVEED